MTSLKMSICPTPRIRRARQAYALRLARSGKINLNENLAWGVGCMRLLGRLFSFARCFTIGLQPFSCRIIKSFPPMAKPRSFIIKYSVTPALYKPGISPTCRYPKCSYNRLASGLKSATTKNTFEESVKTVSSKKVTTKPLNSRLEKGPTTIYCGLIYIKRNSELKKVFWDWLKNARISSKTTICSMFRFQETISSGLVVTKKVKQFFPYSPSPKCFFDGDDMQVGKTMKHTC